MAQHHQVANQELDQDSNMDRTSTRKLDSTTSPNQDSTSGRNQGSSTVSENGTDMPRIIDNPSYTAAVSKVLSHNLKVAQQDASFTALPAPKISTQIEINPIFTVLQRPLDFSFEWEKRPLLNFAGGSNPLRIIPSIHLPLPESTVGAPMLAYWRLNYSTKIKATLTRFGKTDINEPLDQAFGIRDIAELMYTEPVTSSSTPSIRFQPHEDEIIRRGASNVQATNKLMLLTQDRWGSTKYVVDLPGDLGGLSLMWVFSHVEGFADGRLLADRQSEEDTALAETLQYHSGRAANQGDAAASSTSTSDSTSESTPKKMPWAIYPVQQLVDADTGRILATYARNAPLSKTAGTLTIFPKLVAGQPYPYECLSAGLIEGIVIVTAAMVDVQQRIGMLSGLLEAGAESMRWMEEPQHPLRSDS